MADLMCPAPWRTIKAAHDAEFARWELINDSRCGQIDIWRDGKIWKSYDLETIDEVTTIFMSLRDSACWRAALRALAEMEPTEKMKIAIRSELHGVLTSKMIRDAWNGMCIAAAAEGS